MTTFLKRACIVLLALVLLNALLPAKTVIKMATLAPSDSTWVNMMRQMFKEVEDKSKGEIEFRLYPGGVLGDERDMVRRMQIGQLHACAMTSVGLSIIQKEALIFQLPLIFENFEELDYAREKLLGRMETAFSESDYVLLGWGDVGPAYLFSRRKIQKKEDLRNSKVWGWVDDKIAMALYKEAGISPIPLSISEVLTSLQTGVIDTVPSTPLACVALQWFNRLDYMIDLPLSVSVGATVLKKKSFDRLSPKSQEILVRTAKDYHGRLALMIREENDRSLVTLKDQGIEMIPVSEETKRDWETIALGVRKTLVGQLYSQELLDELLRLVEEFRSKGGR
jgi:TRAP-type C4-dicarboxylate transport system substrate-binding protein